MTTIDESYTIFTPLFHYIYELIALPRVCAKILPIGKPNRDGTNRSKANVKIHKRITDKTIKERIRERSNQPGERPN